MALVVSESITGKYVMYRIFQGVTLVFNEEEYLKTNAKEFNHEGTFVLQDAIIEFYYNTPMIEISGKLIDMEKVVAGGEIETRREWKVRTANYSIVMPGVKSSPKPEILNG